MSRPRHIQLPDGEVRLKGFSKERADELARLLTGQVSASDNLEVKEIASKTQNAMIENVTIFSNAINELPEGNLVLGEPERTEEGTSWPVGVEVELNNTALGFHKDSSGNFQLVTLKYNEELAVIENTKNLGKDTTIARHEFKVEIGKKLL